MNRKKRSDLEMGIIIIVFLIIAFFASLNIRPITGNFGINVFDAHNSWIGLFLISAFAGLGLLVNVILRGSVVRKK